MLKIFTTLVVGITLGAFGATIHWQRIEPDLCCEIHTGMLPTMSDGKYNVIRAWEAYDTRRGTPIYVVETIEDSARGTEDKLGLYRLPRENFVGAVNDLPRRPNVPSVKIEVKFAQASVLR